MPLILLLLACAWCIYLVLWWRDSRNTSTGGSGLDRVKSFNSGIDSAGQWSPIRDQRSLELRPRSAWAAARRRRQVFVVLVAAATISLLAAIVFGLIAIIVHVTIDVALLAYAYGCMRYRNLSVEREIKVRMLYPDGVLAGPKPEQIYFDRPDYEARTDRVHTG